MGYEIAGGLGVKMAMPDHEVIVIVGDGSYLMLNSEIATSVMLDQKLVIVVLDNPFFSVTGEDGNACLLGREQLGRRPADPPGTPGDDRRPPGEPEVHDRCPS